MATRIALPIAASVLSAAAYAAGDPAWDDFDRSPLVIAPVPEDVPRPITSRDLVGIRDITGAHISPDGGSVAYVVSQAVLESNGYRTALFVVDTEPGSTPRNLGSAGAPHWRPVGEYSRVSPQWSPDGRSITYLVREADHRQIWLWNRSGGKPRRLTGSAHDVESYEWHPDGQGITFTTVEPLDPQEIRRTAERGILYDSNPTGVDNPIDASRGRPIARAVVEARPRKKRLWIYDLATRTERAANATEEAAYAKPQESPETYKPGDKTFVHDIKRSPDGKTFAYRAQSIDVERSPHYRWTVFTRRGDGGDTVDVVPPTTEVITDLWWSKDGSEIYFMRFVGGTGMALSAVPANGGAQRAITQREDFLLQVSFNQDMSRMAGVRQSALTPPEVVVIDIGSGSLRTVANVNPEFRNIALSVPTRLEWSNKYGDRTFGYLVKPLGYEAGKRYPLIVTTYRASGFLRGAVGDEYPIQVFAANGFAVLAFDVAMGEPIPRPGDYRTAMQRWYSPLASLETAVESLDRMGIIDPKRKGLTGLSYGAQITNFTITHSDLFQAAAASTMSSVDPIWHYLTNGYSRRVYAPYGLDSHPEGEAAPRWKEVSSALNAQKVKAPLLVQVADSEYLYGLQFYTTLRSLGKPVEMVIFADEGHIKNQPQHRYEIYERNVDWFNFWLRGHEDPAESKSEQYGRWRKLRDERKVHASE